MLEPFDLDAYLYPLNVWSALLIVALGLGFGYS